MYNKILFSIYLFQNTQNILRGPKAPATPTPKATATPTPKTNATPTPTVTVTPTLKRYCHTYPKATATPTPKATVILYPYCHSGLTPINFRSYCNVFLIIKVLCC